MIYITKFRKIDWLTIGITTAYAISQLYVRAKMVYVNVPYFSEIVGAQDESMRQWLYTTSGTLLIVGLASFITILFLLSTFKEVWLTKKEGSIKTETKEKVKGKRKEEVKEPQYIRFD